MEDEERPDECLLPTMSPEILRLRTLERYAADFFGLDLIVPCWNYSDFLAETLPYTLSALRHFPGRRLVVTTHDDTETHKVCACFGTDQLRTDAWTRDGASCNRGAAINAAFAELQSERWVLILDADCALVPSQWAFFVGHPLYGKDLHGADRIMLTSPAMWDYARLFLMPGRPSDRLIDRCPQRLDARSQDKRGHYLPRGYFQLFHAQDRPGDYPGGRPNCDGSDLDFAAQWRPDCRRLLPGMLVYHLETDEARQGVNWSGRTTPPFRG